MSLTHNFPIKIRLRRTWLPSEKIVKKKGIPLSFYVDKDSKFITTRHGGLHVSIKKEQEKTQIARAWGEVGINVIYAESPQGKGRIERLWETFQDRLVR